MSEDEPVIPQDPQRAKDALANALRLATELTELTRPAVDDELDAIVDRFVAEWSAGDPQATYIDLRIEYDRDEYRRLVHCVIASLPRPSQEETQ